MRPVGEKSGTEKSKCLLVVREKEKKKKDWDETDK